LCGCWHQFILPNASSPIKSHNSKRLFGPKPGQSVSQFALSQSNARFHAPRNVQNINDATWSLSGLVASYAKWPRLSAAISTSTSTSAAYASTAISITLSISVAFAVSVAFAISIP
jgi:hypothetical protein